MAHARAAAVLLLTLRGTAFVYQGEELGLEDAVVTADTRVDPGGRDGARAPIPWTAQFPHGWENDATWLPFPPDATALNAATQRERNGSILNLYRRLISARRASPALRIGDFAWERSHGNVLAWQRMEGDDKRAVVINFGDHEQRCDLPGAWTVEVASDDAGEGTLYTGVVSGDQALLLRPHANTTRPSAATSTTSPA